MKKTVAALWISVALVACTQRPPQGGTIVIALSSDASVLNPLIATGSNTSAVLQFLFDDLAGHAFDETRGVDSLFPGIAKSWYWSDDRKSLTYELQSGLSWSDGKPLTANDIKYSYRLMADPAVPAVRKSKLDRLIKDEKGQIDWDRAIIVANDSTIRFNFSEVYRREHQLDDTQIYFVPRHYFDSIGVANVATSAYNEQPVSANSFRLQDWRRKQEIILVRDGTWKNRANIDRIIFRVIPDMTAKLVELKNGTVDWVEGLSPEQAADVAKDNSIRIERQQYRRLEYIGWSNIDQNLYRVKKVVSPHPLFGDPIVRIALTMAINRDAITAAALGGYGETAVGPVSPAFRWAVNDTLRRRPYDAEMAVQLLAEAGWSDSDGDGVLDKNGVRFEFTLTTNSGNDRRMFAAELVRADLEKIGIVVKTQQLESNAFNTGLRKREFDAFIAGQVVNLDVELEHQFGSDLSRNVFNVAGYQNAVVDSLLKVSSSYWRTTDGAPELRQVQSILYNDEPVTFLYWYDNIIAIRNRVRGTSVSILSPYYRFRDWYIQD